MPKHERSEYLKGVFFAEEQKEIGWIFKSCNYEEQSLEWQWNSSLDEENEKPRQILFAENEFFDGVIDYQKHMKKHLVKPKKNKVELELDWQDVRKSAEGGNKAFEKWLEEKEL